MLIAYVETYLPMNSKVLQAGIYGILELMNGCVVLDDIYSAPIRFVMVNGLLSFGGLCVWMQTKAAASGVSMKWFYIGKVLQSLLSVSMAGIVQVFLFENSALSAKVAIGAVGVILLIGIFKVLCGKKVVAFWRNVLYDNKTIKQLRCQYAVPKEN